MNFDVDSHLGAMERSVSFLDRDGRPAGAVTLSRSYATAVENLWDAVTNSERILRWFTGISGELELGGRYQFGRQCKRRDNRVRAIDALRAHLGIQRGC